MRSASVFFVIALLLVTPLTGGGQGSSGTIRPTTPKEILGKTLKEWIKEVDDPDPGVRVKAVQIITNFGEAARKEAGSALIKRLSSDRDASVRLNLIMALQAIGMEANDIPEAVKVIQTRMRTDQQAIVRYHLAMLAAQIGTDARVMIPDLIDRAKDQGSYEIRKAALYALGNIGASIDTKVPADGRAVGALIEAFAGAGRDASAEVRLEAVIALAGIGNPATPFERNRILTAFQAGTKDKEKAIAIWAHVGLMAHNEVDDKHLDAITKHLKPNEPYHLRVQACRALGIMGPKVKSRLTDLTDCLTDKEPLFVAVAVWAVGEMGEYAERAVPMLEELDRKKGTDETVKAAIKDALPKITGKKPQK